LFKLRKNHIFLAIALVLVLMVGIAGCGTKQGGSADPGDNGKAEEPGETIELIWGTPFPAEHPQQKLVVDPFVEEVREKSNGRINIVVHPGNTITSSTSVYEDTVSGAMDIGWTIQGWTPGKFPLTALMELPFLWESATEATEVIWTLFEQSEALQKEYEDVYVFNLYTTDIGDIYTRDTPVRSIEDLKSLQLRSASQMVDSILRLFGAESVTLPMPDLYDAVERGTVDGFAAAGHSSLLSYHTYEVTKYATNRMGLYISPQIMFMNKDVWESLSPEDQEIIKSCSGKAMAMKAAAVYDEENQKGLDAMIEAGVEIIEFSPEEMQQFRDAAAPVVEEYIKWLEDQGLPGQETYDLMMQIREEVISKTRN
jgi:TRAP-type C4-dicarboxylate transport system substrate-binding protein